VAPDPTLHFEGEERFFARITIRIDEDVLDWFRDQVNTSGGGNYQTLMNQVLRGAMQESKRPLETVLRKVVREELKRAASK
jgi:hypothetical protein